MMKKKTMMIYPTMTAVEVLLIVGMTVEMTVVMIVVMIMMMMTTMMVETMKRMISMVN